jgi:hypothetical protein
MTNENMIMSTYAAPTNPTVGQTYSFSFDYEFEVDVTGMATNIAKGMIKEYLEANLEKQIIKHVAKIFPGFGMASFIIDIVSAVGVVAGYDGIRFTIELTYKETTKHQAGETFVVSGWKPTGFNVNMI